MQVTSDLEQVLERYIDIQTNCLEKKTLSIWMDQLINKIKNNLIKFS